MKRTFEKKIHNNMIKGEYQNQNGLHIKFN